MEPEMFKEDLYVGAGATINHWSDRTAATIIQILYDGRRLVIQEDKAIRMDNNGMSDSQEYLYEADPNGAIYVVTLRKDGRYKIMKSTQTVTVGVRNKYHDYSF
jgi:hypothetical protein